MSFFDKFLGAGKVIGIIAMVISVLALIIPGGALLITIIGIPLIIFSRGEGAVFGYVAGGLNVINVLFLSPLLYTGGIEVVLIYAGLQAAALFGLYKLENSSPD